MCRLSTSHLRRLLRASLAACLVVLSGAPGAAVAHAELVEATPEPDGVLIDPPPELRITFSEPIDAATAAIRVVDAEQLAVEGVGALELTDGTTTAVLDLPELEPGVYTVAYQVVSTVDGHATAGSYAFLIDPSGAAPPPTDTATFSSPSVDALTVIARWVALAMLLVAFGSLAMWWNAARDSGPPPWALVGMAALLAALGVMAYLALSARPIETPAAPDTALRLPFDIAGSYGWTPFAVAMRLAAVCGLLTAGLSVVASRRSTAQRAAAGIGLALVGAALAGMSFAGHAASIGGPLFAALDWLHLVAAGAWLGGLPATFVLRRRPGRDTAPSLGTLLRRHGRIALVAGPVVVLTGIANSPVVLGSGRDLVASDYGNLVLAKAVLICAALGFGAVNHLALRGRGRGAVAGLVGAELAVAAVAVAVAATMVTIQPAAERRAELTAAEVNPAHFFGEADGVRLHLAVSVPAPGDQAYRVLLTDPASGGPPDEVQRVFITFTPPPGAAEPLRVELMPETGALSGLYVANGPFTPLVGEWELAVIVRRAGERDASANFDMVVTAPGAPELGPPPDTGIGVPVPIAATWSLLPSGPLAWLPAIVLGGLLMLLGRVHRSAWRAVARGVAATILVTAVAAAGSRSLVEAANAPSAAELRGQPAATDGDPSRGEPVYLANCASCHGVRLDGDGPVDTLPRAGSLMEAVRTASDAELSYRITYGIAGTPMPAFAGLLTPDERADLIAYLRQAAAAD